VTDVVYVCIVCGTRLRLEVAATGKAPRHCGEEMDAQVAF
jgi:DNA-directed RNA polymerase subunit RPC12/RpoP